MIFKHVNLKTMLGRLLITSTFVLPAVALAQDDDSSASSNALEEVLVTAQKREESLQDADISVTAVSGEVIRDFNVFNPKDLQAQLPGVQLMGSNIINTTIRGVGTYNNQPNVDAAVAWVIDNAYISHHMATPPILFDIESFEVVRGPLGTLYGRNSNGGAININTAKPELGEYRARAKVGIGNYSQLDTEWMVNVPIGEDAAFRFSLANRHLDGYYDDGSQATDDYAARARFLVAPSESFDMIATLEWSEVDGSGAGLDFCPPRATPSIAGCAGIPWKPYRGFGLPGVYAANGLEGPPGDSPSFNKRTNVSAILEWNYHFDNMTLTSISNYHRYDREELFVWESTTYSPFHENDFVTQELRLANTNSDSKLDWVVGLFYSRENSDGVERFGTQLPPDYQVFQPVSSYGVENGVVTSTAIFGEVTYSVTDSFRLRGGLRYTDEKKDLPGTAKQRLNTDDPVIVATGDVLNTDKPTWLVGFEYDVNDSSMVYGKINTGFKSGTVNAVPPDIGIVPTTTTPEEITAYQIGTKNRFLDNRLQVNAEAFYYVYDGYQVVVTATDPTGFFPGVFFPSVNAQEAKFKGGEVEATWLVGDNGQLNGALTLLDAEHTKFVTPAFDWSGNDVQRAPPYTATVGYTHDFPLSSGSNFRGSFTTQFVDGNYTRDSNAPVDWQDSYHETSAFLRYTSSSGRWSVTGWVRNLEDETVIDVTQSAVGRGGYNVFMRPPRMYGLTFQYEM